MSDERPTFHLVLRAERGCTDPIKNLRHLLKRALRTYRLRCVSAVAHIEEEPSQ